MSLLFYLLVYSVHFISISLGLINKSLLENKKIPNKLIIINGLTFLVSSSIVVYNFTLLIKYKN